MTDYRQCKKCGFWLSAGKVWCADCGSYENDGPLSALQLLAGLAGGCTLGAALGLPLGALGSFWGAVIGSTSAAFLMEAHRDRLERQEHTSLAAQERQIRGRLAELERNIERIGAVRARLEAEPGSAERAPVLAALAEAERGYPACRDRYRVKLLELEHLRLVNRLEVLATGLSALPYAWCEDRLQAVAECRPTAERLLRQLAEIDPAVAPDAGIFQSRLEGTLAGCDQLRRALTDRQALCLLETVAEGGSAPAVTMALEAPGLSHTGTEIEAFSAGLRQLDSDHAHLQAELEVATLGKS